MLVLVGVVTLTYAVRAELPEWVRNVDAGGRLRDAVFQSVAMPGGPVEARRTPDDAYARLRALPAAAGDRELIAMRARAAEEALDAAAAETEWSAYAAASADAAEGQVALADFYHRRLMPQQEADALAAAAGAPDEARDRLLPRNERRSWRVFERLMTLVESQRLPDAFAEAQYRAWIARHPDATEPYDRLFRFLLDRNRPADAEAIVATYQRAFPADDAWPLRARADLATRRGATRDALAVYDQAFRPLWKPEIVDGYLDLLERTFNLRAFLERARADIAARPDDLTPVARLFYYYQRAGNAAAAERALADFEARRASATRTADELLTLARLYERTRNYDEAIRYYAAVYSLPAAAAADTETALASIVTTLLTVPEQPIRFGSGDLSFYRDIATIDQSPGFLNGVLSLLFNSESPEYRLAEEESQAAPYFRRGRAAELLAIFEARFPQSPRRAPLQAALITTYAAYGASDPVIQLGQRFIAAFPDAAERTAVMLAMADAYARKEQVTEELAAYDRLLQELAQRADRVPLGANAAPNETRGAPREAGVRSPEYARVLDRYIARLVSRKQLTDAFAVYRREIDRNPDDPGVYAAAAQFLESNDVAADLEAVYRAAMQRFPDRSWHHRLARWYLRARRTADFDALTREVVRTFDGTDLAEYFQWVVGPGPELNAQLYLQLNRYAYERFPHQPTFVRSLLDAYTSTPTRDDRAYEALLRRHWFEDDTFTSRFFALLSRTGRLDAEIAEVRATSGPAPGDWTTAARQNPTAVRFLAEAGIWESQFESATPILSALSSAFPGDAGIGHRAASLHRSLAYLNAGEADAAAAVEERLHRFAPRDAATVTVLGEIYADRGRFDRARAYWNQLPEIEPGNAAGYVETATVFWDYYQFEDALRILAEGRARLGSPSLHAYEAGAIYENMRQPAAAIDEYVRGALAAPDGSAARTRLLTLARRPPYRDAVERASLAAVAPAGAASNAVSLRIAVLEAQDRRSELEGFLLDVLDRTSSLELMAEIGSHADRLGFDAVRTRSLTRQIETMTDPVERLRLRYELVRLYESRGEAGPARAALEALYAEQPRLLGVVRQTVDYYWRHDLRREAIAALTRAAQAAHPDLRKRFTFEAARKSADTGDYAAARDLLRPLLADDPFNAEYLAAVADTYARAGEDQALRDFYVATIESMRTAALPADERMRRIAGLRRGLIPALTRLNDHAGAVAQYIEILNRFPDDDALVGEAGRYARRYDRAPQLVAYYTKTAAESPRDYRWPMLLARLQTQFEDFPAAIAAYAGAISIRPDRADFHTSRGALEERLLRFDAAVESYSKAYDLTYRAPQWMEKIAELHARRGRPAEAARALRAALIDGRPERAENFFAAADRLDGWDMLAEARPFADDGARLAGDQGLLDNGRTYVRIATRLRQSGQTFDRLMSARNATGATPNRDRFAGPFGERLRDMADVVAREYTPEEKAAFAALLDQRRAAVPRGDMPAIVDSLLEPAGLAELAARWQAAIVDADPRQANTQRLVQVQTGRLRFAELAQQLEAAAPRAGTEATALRLSAADAYRKAGDGASELRVLTTIGPALQPADVRERYFELLLPRNPQQLLQLAATGRTDVRDAAANHVVANGTADQALAIVQARGRGLAPVWTDTYTALVGFHHGRYDAATTGAFRSALGPMTVAERMRDVDRARLLAGDTWFAQASRFGEYLSFAGNSDAADYLPAEIEHTPARSDAYVTLADFYRDRRDEPGALAEYGRGAELNPNRSDVHVRAAEILWARAARDEAIARWRTAMQLLTAQASRGAADSSPVAAVLESVADRGAGQPLRDAADAMIRAYLSRNGTYRAADLMRGAFRVAADPAAGTEWLIDLAGAAPDEVGMLASIADATWLPDASRDRVYERIVVASEQVVARRFGTARDVSAGALERWRIRRIRSLVDTRQASKASSLLNALTEAERTRHRDEVLTLEARIAAAEGSLGSLLDRLARQEDESIVLAALREAATALRRSGDRMSERRIMEFVYTRELGQEASGPAPFLGLAEIRLEERNQGEALALLRRLTVAVGEPFEHHAAAAALLERFNRPGNALEFRRARAQAVPWDGDAQVALARTELAASAGRPRALDRLNRVAESPSERYDVRVSAARAFGAAGGTLGRQPQSEIDLLRVPAQLVPSAVDRPMFVDARLAAAERTASAAARADTLRPAVAVNPARLDVRIALFRAEAAAGRPAAAVEALWPVVTTSRSLARLALAPAERFRVARELAEALERTGRLSDAARYYTIALEGQPAATLAAVRARLASVNGEIRRRAENAARRPHVSASLDQPRLVRPVIPPPRAVAAVALDPVGPRP